MEAIDLDFAVERLQPLLFVIQGLLSRLRARLEARRLGCGEFCIHLDLVSHGNFIHAVSIKVDGKRCGASLDRWGWRRQGSVPAGEGEHQAQEH